MSSNNPQRIALYAGSFDPLTNGHMDIIAAALKLVDRLEVAIGIHAQKKATYAFELRKQMILDAARTTFGNADMARIDIFSFDGLVVKAARMKGAQFLIRGLRDGADFDDELRMASMNRLLAPDISTVFLAADAENRAISSTLVRQIIAMKGDISHFVPAPVLEKLRSYTQIADRR